MTGKNRFLQLKTPLICAPFRRVPRPDMPAGQTHRRHARQLLRFASASPPSLQRLKDLELGYHVPNLTGRGIEYVSKFDGSNSHCKQTGEISTSLIFEFQFGGLRPHVCLSSLR